MANQINDDLVKGEREMDYRRTRVEAFVVRNNHLLMVRERDHSEMTAWRLPAADLEEGETPEEGVIGALVTETGMEGRVLDFLRRKKPKQGEYRLVLTYHCELLPTADTIGYDPKDRLGGPNAYEVSWRSLRNPELQEEYREILRKARF
ncbi:MAG: NUDIX domain-containing protein [Bacillota bacterium]|jgi:ADP-ribose pyrophosphatase YjhB (NUDIX family)